MAYLSEFWIPCRSKEFGAPVLGRLKIINKYAAAF